MKFAKRLLMVAGAVAVAGILSVALAPRAVHAVVASLVEVSNTTASPVPTADVYGSAARSVALLCSFPINGYCISMPPTGGTNTAYTVPAGQTLMVTDVEITTVTGGGSDFFGLEGLAISGFTGNQSWFVPNDGSTHEFTFPNGIPYPAGSQLAITGASAYTAFVRGYLTPY